MSSTTPSTTESTTTPTPPTTTDTSTRWLVCVDEGEHSSIAFTYAVEFYKPGDHLFIINVTQNPNLLYGGSSYAGPAFLTSVQDANERKSRKILVHYGHRAHDLGFTYTLLRGSYNDACTLICQAVKDYKIDTCVIGRRTIGSFPRFFLGSTSKDVLEKVDCNVVVAKAAPGIPADLSDAIGKEQEDRLERLKEEEADAKHAETEKEKDHTHRHHLHHYRHAHEAEENEDKRRHKQYGIPSEEEAEKLQKYRIKQELGKKM